MTINNLPSFRMSISRNWSQLYLDNTSDKEKISKGLFPHQTSHQHLEMRRHLMVVKKLQGLFPRQTSYQRLEIRCHLTVVKKLQRFVSSSNFLPALGGKMPFDGCKETSKVCFLVKLLTSAWRYDVI